MTTTRFTCLILDYGHGGEIDGRYVTAGKQYTHTDVSPPLALYEGIEQRKIATLIIEQLLEAGVQVFDCVAGREWSTAPTSWRELEQRDVPLSQRTRHANQHRTGLLYSCHSNAIGMSSRGPSQAPRGIDIYTSRGQTRSDEVATSVHAALSKTAPAVGLPMRRGQWSDGDVDYESGLWMLRKTVMPAVLGEHGFHTNLADAQVLASVTGQHAIASGVVAGLLPFLARS